MITNPHPISQGGGDDPCPYIPYTRQYTPIYPMDLQTHFQRWAMRGFTEAATLWALDSGYCTWPSLEAWPIFWDNYYWGRILSGDRICHDAWFEAAFLIGSNPWDWGILRVDSDHSSWCLSRGTFCLFGPWGNAVFLVPRQPRFLYPVPVLQAASRRPSVATLPTSPLSSLEWRVGGRCGNCHLGMPRKKDKTW